MAADLKKSIVIVNEYSVPLPGGKGSRGGTPGAYVERYMARDQATESLAPVQRLRTDDFILRYMARETAVEHAPSRGEAKREMRQAQGLGGVAFGYGSVSLSDDQLRAASADIQSHFESGKTVLKTVLSFDEAYLKTHGLVDEDFTLHGRGDYRGHLDQMKLRMAIMQGIDRMSGPTSGYDDLRAVGVIQVDTEHVHAHLAMVDAGSGQITKDGTQRGKLLDRHKSRLRRGIDSFLDEKQAVKHLSSAVGYERRNVTTFIKRWAHERIQDEALPQFVLACLPEDRALWRAGTNDKRMRKANRLVTELVTEQLERPGSPMPAAMERVQEYADERRERERLAPAQWQKLVDTGRDQIVERAVNGVYGVLKALPEEELRIRTPLLQVMSMDYEQLAAEAAGRRENGVEEDDLVSFGFRLRSYSSRLAHHKDKGREHRKLAQQWERADAAGVAARDSQPMHQFYRVEEDWHDRLRDKYQHFLPFLGDASQWYEQQRQVAEYGRRLLALRALRNDATLQRMKDADEAEELGRAIYGQSGGRHLTAGPRGRAVLDARLVSMRDAYDEKVATLRDELADAGLVLTLEGDGEAEGALEDGQVRRASGLVVPREFADDAEPEPAEPVIDSPEAMTIDHGLQHPYREVKGLDLHHLGYDFVRDVPVGRRVAQTFSRAAAQRKQALMGAMDYLDASGQSAAIADLPVDDVARMSALAKDLDAQADVTPSGNLVLRSRLAALREAQVQRMAEASEASTHHSKAPALDSGLLLRVRERVDVEVREASKEQQAQVSGLRELG